MNLGRPPYDERAVNLVIAIDEHIASLGPPTDQKIRRARMIRAAIEGQVEYVTPRPDSQVLDLLAQALLRELSHLPAADIDGMDALLSRLRTYIQSRPHPT